MRKTLYHALAILSFFAIVSEEYPANSAKLLEYAYPGQPQSTLPKGTVEQPTNRLTPLAAHLFKEAVIPWRERAYPAKRVIRNLIHGRSTFSILVSPQPALQNCCLESKKPVLVLEVGVYSFDGKPKIETIEDLIGKKISLIQGFSYAGIKRELDKHTSTTLFLAPDRPTAFKLLVHGRADYLLDYPEGADEFLHEDETATLQYSVLRKTSLHLYLNKEYPNAEILMKKLETIASEIDTRQFLAPANQR